MTVEDQASNAIELSMGQVAVDKEGQKLGKIRALFPRYALVQKGGLFVRAYYIPITLFSRSGKGVVQVALTEDELRERGYHNIPDDLVPETPEPENPRVDGTPQFGRRPLSPAQTGHYNYGRHWPGINTDASGSYHREEVLPRPQIFVEEASEDHNQG